MLPILLLAPSPQASQSTLPPSFFSVSAPAKGGSSFVTPAGQPFWSFGVCCVDRGTSKDKYNLANPSYHAWGLFKDDQTWALDSVSKLKSWGFNTLGGWSDYKVLSTLPAERQMPYTVVLHLGAYYRAPWDDLFSAEARKAIFDAAKTQIEPVRNDPNLIGYFSDNELGWWDDTLFLSYVEKLPPNSPGRKAAHATLRDLYGSFKNFQTDWITTSTSWEDFADKPSLKLRPGGSGMRAVNAWMSKIGNHYYRTVHEAIRTYDRRHLILGDRYAQYYNISLAKSSAKWIDVSSTNMGADWTDGTFSHFYLDTLNKITRKPVLITEFYMCAMENRSGNKNSSAGFPTVQTQRQRADAFGVNVRGLGKLPFVIGAHWFQYTDEPTHGREDGENFNMGLLDLHGETYKEITKVAKAARASQFAVRPITPVAKSGTIPSVLFNPLKTASIKSWPREASLILPTSGDAFADLHVVQDKQAVYVSLYAMDYADVSLYENREMPESERCHWQVSLGTKKVSVRFGGQTPAGKNLPVKVQGLGVQAVEKQGLKHTIVLRIPKAALGIGRKLLKLTSTLSSHSRAESIGWAQALRMSR